MQELEQHLSERLSSTSIGISETAESQLFDWTPGASGEIATLVLSDRTILSLRERSAHD